MPIRTGDIIATLNGEASLYGQLYRLIGALIPGEPDHLAIYLGPGGLCVEAGPHGVVSFHLHNESWDAGRLFNERGILDSLYGVGDFVSNASDELQSEAVRRSIRHYVIDQVGKPYNYAFRESSDDTCFYCSQLVVHAAMASGLDLDLSFRPVHPLIPEGVITPETVWHASTRLRRTVEV